MSIAIIMWTYVYYEQFFIAVHGVNKRNALIAKSSKIFPQAIIHRYSTANLLLLILFCIPSDHGLSYICHIEIVWVCVWANFLVDCTIICNRIPVMETINFDENTSKVFFRIQHNFLSPIFHLINTTHEKRVTHLQHTEQPDSV